MSKLVVEINKPNYSQNKRFMKKLFTSTLFATFLYLNAFAQQPVVWPITGNGTSPSSSWAAINYDAS
ncbi:hypothetical protein EIM50_21575, partial [Pseudoxanthomonas sp. SGD-10]